MAWGLHWDALGTLLLPSAQCNPQAMSRQYLGNTQAIPLQYNTHSGSTPCAEPSVNLAPGRALPWKNCISFLQLGYSVVEMFKARR